VCFELADYHSDESIRLGGVQCLIEELAAAFGEHERQEMGAYHKAQITPLIQEIPIDINAVRLTQILGNECSNRRQILFFQCMLILYVSQFRGQVCHPFLRFFFHTVDEFEIGEKRYKGGGRPGGSFVRGSASFHMQTQTRLKVSLGAASVPGDPTPATGLKSQLT